MIIYLYRDDIFYKESAEEQLKIRPVSYLKKFNKRMVTGIIILEDQPASLFISNEKKIVEQKIKQMKSKFLVATLESKGLFYAATIRKNRLSNYKIKAGKFALLAVYPVSLLLTDALEDGILVTQLDEQKLRYDYYENSKLVHSQVANEDEQEQINFYLKRNNIIVRPKQTIPAYGSNAFTQSYEKFAQLMLEKAQEARPDSSFIGFNHIHGGSLIKTRYLFGLILMIVLTVLTAVKYFNFYKIENEYIRVKEVETDIQSFNGIISNNITFFSKLFTRNYPFNGAVITRSFYHPDKKVMEIQGYTAQNFDSFMNNLNSTFDNVQLISSYYQREVNLFKIMIHLGETNAQ